MQLQRLNESVARDAQNVSPEAILPVHQFPPPSPRSNRAAIAPPARQNALIRFAVLNVLRPSACALRLLFLLATVATIQAAPVTFGFSGQLTHATNPSNVVGGLTVGTPFTGSVTFDPALTKFPSDFPSPNTEYYNFTNAAGLSFVLQVGAHTFTGRATNDSQSGIIIFDNFDSHDMMSAWFNPSCLTHNGSPLPGQYSHGGFVLRLSDTNQTVFTSDALPTAPPLVTQFTTPKIELSMYVPGQLPAFEVVGRVTSLTSQFQPQLTIRPQANGSVQITWPLAAIGFALESRDQPHSGTWTPVVQAAIATENEYVVTISTGTTPQYFRLAKSNP